MPSWPKTESIDILHTQLVTEKSNSYDFLRRNSGRGGKQVLVGKRTILPNAALKKKHPKGGLLEGRALNPLQPLWEIY